MTTPGGEDSPPTAHRRSSGTAIDRVATRLILLWLAVVFLGAVYQLAVGAKLLRIGPEPGDDPPMGSLFFMIPMILLIGGGFVAWFAVAMSPVVRMATRSRWFIAVPLVAVLFPASRAVAFDPYFAPNARRYWDVNTSGTWLFVLIVFAVLISILALWRPGTRVVTDLTSIAMIASGMMAAFEGLH